MKRQILQNLLYLLFYLSQNIKGLVPHQPNRVKFKISNIEENDLNLIKIEESTMITKRQFIGAAIFGMGQFAQSSSSSALPWEPSPINKRTGVTVYKAEEFGYNVRFVTYLSRFLLNFDADCQKWWYSRAIDIPRKATADEVNDIRLKQFGAFSASVEVGLQEYKGSDGPSKLMKALIYRYCPTETSSAMSQSSLKKKQNEIKEARRQIALLFGLMDGDKQPVEDITSLLALIENATIPFVQILDSGSGYSPDDSPAVIFPEPASENGRVAQGRCKLKPNGKILRIDLINRGKGYTEAPKVMISSSSTGGTAAIANAIVFKGKSDLKSSIERIEIVQPGTNYTLSDIIKVTIDPPPTKEGVQATAKAILEYEIEDIEMIDNGYGYAVEKDIVVTVEPPQLTARVNMNDPIIASTFPITEAKKAQNFANRGGGGNCIGRACYDSPVKAFARAKSERDTYFSFRDVVEDAASGKFNPDTPYISAAAASSTYIQFWDKTSASAQLLQLIPSGIGLQYKPNQKRYILVTSQTSDYSSGVRSFKPLDPEFGPRGRSPIERSRELDLSTSLRFCLSGALSCSGAHLFLTPIDVVKTKIQTQPTKYNQGIFNTYQMVWQEEGPTAFFTGWLPTFLGWFATGGVSYTSTELFRRVISDLIVLESFARTENKFASILYDFFSASPEKLDVFIIILASGLGACLAAATICPFETVRIRSVAQPNYASSNVAILERMVNEEGIESLFSAVPTFLLKEVPYSVTKFTIFDISTAYLYQMYPAAREDLKLSLLISLVGGTVGGIAAAIISNPADAIISQMKKSSSGDTGPINAYNELVEEGGFANLFRGLPLRCIFYPILVSIQFFIYDAIRFSLGVGSDDLKLYLDVLGGALKETGGPV